MTGGRSYRPGDRRAALSLSFDDARPSQLDHAVPVLARYGVAATFYVLPDAVRTRLAEWREVVAAGHEIGNHTVSHPCSGNFGFSRRNPLEAYDLARMERDELLAANDAIGRLLGVRPASFAYPCGQRFVGAGERTRSYVPLVARHFTVGRGAFDETPNDPAICDLAQVAAMDMDGATPERLRGLVDWALREGRWLVLAGHDVGVPGPRVVPAGSLEALCGYARQHADRLWTAPVAAAGTSLAHRRAATGARVTPPPA